ncbi:MAG: TonB-dependent receptor, partial [Chloroflexi bacterium]|nr:TonB-dependent receptor [Chloroflexota bacterium]
VSATSLGLSNPDLKWEESTEFDAGIDVAFFKNRLSATVDFYNRKSTNMLLNNIIPAITGFNNQTVNKGNVRNRGFEIALGGTPVKSDLRWDINLNISINRNKVIAMNDNSDPIVAGNFWSRPSNITKVGKPIGQLYGLIWEGLLTAADIADPKVIKFPGAVEGQNKYKDVDGDGTITDILDYDIIGNPWPDFIFGATNRVSYKNFSLSLALQGQYGGNVVDGMHGTTDNLQGAHNLREEWVNRWRSATDPGDGKHPGLANTDTWTWKLSNNWVEDASYLRISNLTLDYSLPKRWTSSTGFIKKGSLYLSVNNLAMFTNYHGANPEGERATDDNTLVLGFDHTSYPLARVTSIGINLSF